MPTTLNQNMARSPGSESESDMGSLVSLAAQPSNFGFELLDFGLGSSLFGFARSFLGIELAHDRLIIADFSAGAIIANQPRADGAQPQADGFQPEPAVGVGRHRNEQVGPPVIAE